MKLIRCIWFLILKRFGIRMSSVKKKCISSLEERLFEIDDDEYLITIAMLDAGFDCESIFVTLRTARRKRSFKRQLTKLGIKGVNLQNLLDHFITELRSDMKIEELVMQAHQEYLNALENKKSYTV